MWCVLCCSDSDSDCVQGRDGATTNTSESKGDTNSEADSDGENIQDGSHSTHSAVESGDINRVLLLKQQRSPTDQEKLSVLEHSFVPPPGYHFPTRIISGCKRHFQNSWLSKYNGLVYSESTDGGFCKFCVLFGKGGPRVKELGVLVNKPLTNFKKATEKLDDHFHGTLFHKSAMEAAILFIQMQINKRFQ